MIAEQAFDHCHTKDVDLPKSAWFIGNMKSNFEMKHLNIKNKHAIVIDNDNTVI